jgi:hypothetical protein
MFVLQGGPVQPVLATRGLCMHVLQAVLAAAPDKLFGRLWDAFFAGSLAALTSGPIANFVVQAALASARTGSQVGTSDARTAEHALGRQDCPGSPVKSRVRQCTPLAGGSSASGGRL